MIKALIVENEKPNINLLTGILSKEFSEIEIVAVCTTVLEATEKINLLKPELVFLDIQLDQKDGGFTVLNHTRSVNYEVIFTTSHAEYAPEAFRFCALHFLLRPFGKDDLQEAINRFIEKNEKGSGRNIEAFLHNVKQTDPSLHRVGIPVLSGYEFITVQEIIMCKSENNCTDIQLTNKGKILATKTLKWVEALLLDHHFYRVHDSYLINLNHIKKYKRGGEGGVVELTDQKEADVARRRKDDFLKVLSDLKMIFNK